MKYEVTLYYVKQFYIDDIEADDRDEALKKAKEIINEDPKAIPDDEYLDDWYVKEIPPVDLFDVED